MELTAYAKINWDLYVLGKRPDGYHEVDTVMASVDLGDRLEIEPARGLSMTCSNPALPCDDGNLVIKAARALAKAAGVAADARIHLEKRIPAGGGLGGGSSDAALALRGLNELWNLGWSRERLNEIASTLGSDIGFFLWGGWARCRSRGEIVEPLPESAQWPSIRLLLILPPLGVPTPPVYKALNAPPLDGKKRLRNLTSLSKDINVLLARISKSEPFTGWPNNGLLKASCFVEPKLNELQAQLEQLYAGRWQMSGSGAVHVVVPIAGETARIAKEKINAGLSYAVDVIETRTITPCSSP